MTSDHKNEYVLELSQEAYDDLFNIQNYTYAMHGEQQWREYGELLDSALLHISKHPFSGHGRPDLPTGYLAWNAGEHIMIYRVEREIIYLVRVLHGRMDFTFQSF